MWLLSRMDEVRDPMRLAGYKGKHLRPRPRRRGPVVVGTAAAIWVGQCAVAYAGEHVVSKGETLSDIAVRYGTTTGALARANGLGDPNLIVAGTTISIPTGSSSGSAVDATHTIRAGETLSDLAQRFGTTVDALARANGISNPNLVVAGTKIMISGGGGGSASVATSTTSHTVQAGETLWDLAQRFGTTVDALARANGISNPNLVVAGTKIMISGGGGGSASVATSGASHTVQAGETLSDIAARFGVSVNSLARANGISNPNLIVAGTAVSVPGGGSASASVPAPVSSTEVGYLLEQEAVANGLNPSLIKAMAYQESGWQQDVVSSAGAIGVMQVMPGTARWVNKVLLGGASLNVRSAHDNIRMGVSYMRYLLNIMPTQDQALAAYYSGPGNVGSKLRRYQRVYVDAVNAHVTRF